MPERSCLANYTPVDPGTETPDLFKIKRIDRYVLRQLSGRKKLLSIKKMAFSKADILAISGDSADIENAGDNLLMLSAQIILQRLCWIN